METPCSEKVLNLWDDGHAIDCFGTLLLREGFTAEADRNG